MDGLAVISGGLAAGRKSGSAYPVENIDICVEAENEVAIAVEVESEINVIVGVE